jgi:hypothetical protein
MWGDGCAGGRPNRPAVTDVTREARVADGSPVVGPRWGLPRGVIILLGTASAVVTIGGIRVGAWLIGPLGAVLAIPLTLLVKAPLVDIDPGASWVDALLRDRPIAAATPAGQPDPAAAAGSAVSKDGAGASAASKDGAPAAARKDGVVVVDVQSGGSPAGSGAAAGAPS